MRAHDLVERPGCQALWLRWAEDAECVMPKRRARLFELEGAERCATEIAIAARYFNIVDFHLPCSTAYDGSDKDRY